MSDAIVGQVKKAECSQCGGSRNCEILGFFAERGGDEFVSWHKDWHLLQCRGCDEVFVQTVSTNSEEYDYEEDVQGNYEVVYTEYINYWPSLSKRKPPDWLAEISSSHISGTEFHSAMLELYGALNNDLNMLAGIGMRTCFDIAAEYLGIKPDLSFRAKLQKLVDGGHIGLVDKDRLEILVEAGSASAHRGWRPNAEHLNTLMDVLEHFIQEAFVAPARKKKLDAQIGKIGKQVPPRPARSILSHLNPVTSASNPPVESNEG